MSASLRPLRVYIFSLKSSSSSASSFSSTRCGAATTASSRFFSFRSSLWGTRTRTISGRFEIGKATKSASSFYSSSSSENNNNNNNNYYYGEEEKNQYKDAFASPPLVVSNGDRLSGPGANRAIKWVPSDAKSNAFGEEEASYAASNNKDNYYARETPSAPPWGASGGGGGGGLSGQQQTQTQTQNRGNNNYGGPGASYSSSSSYGGGGGGYNNNNNNNNSSSSSSSSGRTFVDFSIYKSKSALSVKLVKPTFETDHQGRTIMKRSGGILLEFAPSIGTRKYDWTRKGSFMLSPIEAAELANRLNPSRQSIAQKVEFFHDPGMGGSSQGSVTKSLKMEAMPDGTGGVFLNYNQTKFGEKLNVNIPVSFGEVSALELLIKHLVPRVMGFFEEDSSTTSSSSTSSSSAAGYGY
tara:strand:- start:94 stop:1326 length:1233 start_codon:yes stop_codon:yes gene_type:complete